jgi:hypothetical protein
VDRASITRSTAAGGMTVCGMALALVTVVGLRLMIPVK